MVERLLWLISNPSFLITFPLKLTYVKPGKWTMNEWIEEEKLSSWTWQFSGPMWVYRVPVHRRKALRDGSLAGEVFPKLWYTDCYEATSNGMWKYVNIGFWTLKQAKPSLLRFWRCKKLSKRRIFSNFPLCFYVLWSVSFQQFGLTPKEKVGSESKSKHHRELPGAIRWVVRDNTKPC